jgi:uncharacterized protein
MIYSHLDSNVKCCFIGSSFGGLIATLVAQRRPSFIHSLLLLTPAFNPVRIWSSKLNVERWQQIGSINMYNSVQKCDMPIDYSFYLDLQLHAAYPLVTTCPITIIHGLQDEIVPVETSRKYYQTLLASSKHPLGLIEVDDDHHLRKETTLHTIENVILHRHQ